MFCLVGLEVIKEKNIFGQEKDVKEGEEEDEKQEEGDRNINNA